MLVGGPAKGQDFTQCACVRNFISLSLHGVPIVIFLEEKSQRQKDVFSGDPQSLSLEEVTSTYLGHTSPKFIKHWTRLQNMLRMQIHGLGCSSTGGAFV